MQSKLNSQKSSSSKTHGSTPLKQTKLSDTLKQNQHKVQNAKKSPQDFQANAIHNLSSSTQPKTPATVKNSSDVKNPEVSNDLKKVNKEGSEVIHEQPSNAAQKSHKVPLPKEVPHKPIEFDRGSQTKTESQHSKSIAGNSKLIRKNSLSKSEEKNSIKKIGNLENQSDFEEDARKDAAQIKIESAKKHSQSNSQNVQTESNQADHNEQIITTQMIDCGPKFREGDIVWAKVRGHAWWPAYLGNVCRRLKSNSELKYIVLFIGDPTRSHLAERYIRNFKEAFFQLAFIPKTKKLLKDSITKACKMYSKIDPDFESFVKTSFIEGNVPIKSPGIACTDDSNYSNRGGYRGGKRRRGRGRGRGRARGGQDGSLEPQRNLSKDSIKYSQSGCSYSLLIKQQLADQYFQYNEDETSSIEDYKHHAMEIGSYSITNQERDEESQLDSLESQSDQAVYARSKQVMEMDAMQQIDDDSCFLARSVSAQLPLKPSKKIIQKQYNKKREFEGSQEKKVLVKKRKNKILHKRKRLEQDISAEQKSDKNSIDNNLMDIGSDIPRKRFKDNESQPRLSKGYSKLLQNGKFKFEKQSEGNKEDGQNNIDLSPSSPTPYHTRTTACKECGNKHVQIRFKCNFMKKQKLAMKKQAVQSSTNATMNNLQGTQQSGPTNMCDLKVEHSISQNKLPLTDQEQEMMRDDEKEREECFAKQLEISSQFSYDFEKFDDLKGDFLTNSNDPKAKITKLVRLTEDDWKYLQNGRQILAQIRQLFQYRNQIQDAYEQIMECLDQANTFNPLFVSIYNTLKQLKHCKIISVQTLTESRICACLNYLIDLCFVILESIQIEEARRVGKLSQELITKWRMLVTSKVIEETSDHKSDIRRILRDSYPAQFTTMRKLSRHQSQILPVSSHFNSQMNRGMTESQYFQGGQNWQRSIMPGRQSGNNLLNQNWNNQAQISHQSVGDQFQNRLINQPTLHTEQDAKNFDPNSLLGMRPMQHQAQQYQEQIQANANRIQVSSIMSRTSNMSGQNVQNFQMQNLLQMQGKQMESNPDFFVPDIQMQGQQGPMTSGNFMNSHPNMLRASSFSHHITQVNEPFSKPQRSNLIQPNQTMSGMPRSQSEGFNNPDVFQQPQPPLIPRYPNRSSEFDKSQKDMQSNNNQSNDELD